MIKKWSKSWKASKQPRKQHAFVRNAPLHVLRNLLAAHVAKSLRAKVKHRSLPVRVGDTVKIARGEFRAKIGKVERVDVRKCCVFITGIEQLKKNGSKSLVPVHPSNIIIQEIVADTVSGGVLYGIEGFVNFVYNLLGADGKKPRLEAGL